MTKTHYTILFLFLTVFISCKDDQKQGNGGVETLTNKTFNGYREIIKINTDERGLISIMFKEGTDTMALDYLAVKGFNHWLRGEIDSVYNDACRDVESVSIVAGRFTNKRTASFEVGSFCSDSIIKSLAYNIDNNLIWSLEPTPKEAQVILHLKSGYDSLLFIPYKPYGICCNDSTEIKIKQHNKKQGKGSIQ